jgi:hypothetical protein
VLLLACTKDQPARPAPAYEGFHDVATCDAISGWAWDRNQPDQPIKVEVLDGDNWITTLPADRLRGDLVGAGKGNGYHAFSMKVPPSLKDGRPHVINVKYQSGGALDRSSKTITCP